MDHLSKSTEKHDESTADLLIIALLAFCVLTAVILIGIF